MRFDWKEKTVQDFIQNRVNIEAYLDEPEYPRPLARDERLKRDWSPTAVMAFVGHLIKSNLP